MSFKWNMVLGVCSLFLFSACTTTVTTTRVIGGTGEMKVDYQEAYRNYLTLGIEYIENGRYDLAEARLRRAIEIDSQNPDAWNALAVMYEEKRDVAMGDQVYRKLIASHPDYLFGYYNYATFLCKFSREGDLNALFSQMRARNNNEISALSYISEGDCRVTQGRNREAVLAYQQALNYDNHAAGALLPLADLMLKEGNYQQALNYVNVLHSYIGYTPESVRVGILAARALGNTHLENDLLRIMRSSYRDSEQARSLGV